MNEVLFDAAPRSFKDSEDAPVAATLSLACVEESDKGSFGAGRRSSSPRVKGRMLDRELRALHVRCYNPLSKPSVYSRTAVHTRTPLAACILALKTTDDESEAGRVGA